MKLYELFGLISESETLWVNDGTDTPILYDGKNNIDERYNNMVVERITVSGDGFLTVEIESLVETVERCLHGLCEEDLFTAWNNYCEKECDTSNKVHTMEDFDDFFYGWSAKDVAEMVVDGNYDSYSEYFTYSGGYLECFHDVDEAVDYENLAEYIVDLDDSLGVYTIRLALDGGC